MNKTTLVVMAAGMGSRFGGLKQIAPIGPDGEIILDFSVHDAVKAGFSKTVFIIKKQIEKDFREAVGRRIEKMTDVAYVFQDTDHLPVGRTKPWGTGDAVLAAESEVSTPFAVINADDFYGFDAYDVVNKHLSEKGTMCMAGFELGNTLTDNGTVCRGVCDVENGLLKSVTEHYDIGIDTDIPKNTIVSMNMFGFDLDIFGELHSRFEVFMDNLTNPVKQEFLLPEVVDALIKSGKKTVSVLPVKSRWYGITYKEDLPGVQSALTKLCEEGQYKF